MERQGWYADLVNHVDTASRSVVMLRAAESEHTSRDQLIELVRPFNHQRLINFDPMRFL
jgi:hypothetical protein